jgi:anthranilate phosphoribosyltransferase
METILSGRATPAQAGAFLLLQRYKGETPDEILGFTDAVRARARLIQPRVEGLLDVGSPYDGRLRNVVLSPAASIVAAAAGLPVVMHGEKDMPPKHGLGVVDVLEALGVPVDLEPEAVERCIEEVGLGFMRSSRFVPDLYALKWLREETALRSALNTVEKIYNLAGAPYHLIGLTHLPYLNKMGGALVSMGFRKSVLVQGMEGNEDLSTARATRVIEFAGEATNEYRLNPQDYGLAPADQQELSRCDLQHCVEMTRAVLSREDAGPWRDLVLLNAGFRLHITERAPDVGAGIEMAREAIDSGAAQRKLDAWQGLR